MSGSAASGAGVGAGGGAGGGGGGAVALGGLGGSLEDKDCELLCPVCFELIEEAYVTRCGHSFCFGCVAKAVELHRRCPKCGAALASREHIFPNFLLNELVAKRRLRSGRGVGGSEAVGAVGGGVGGGGSEAGRLRALVASSARHLALADVEGLLEALARRKRLLQAESAAAHHRLLLEFLHHLHRSRQQQLQQLTREAALVKRDMEHVTGVLQELQAAAEPGDDSASAPGPSAPGPAPRSAGSLPRVRDRRPQQLDGCVPAESPGACSEEESFAGGAGGGGGGGGGGAGGGAGDGGDALAARWRKLTAHFDDFVQCYFAHRADELYFPGSGRATPTGSATPGPGLPDEGGVSLAGPAPSLAGPAPSLAGPAPASHSPLGDDHVPQAPSMQHSHSSSGDQRLPEGVSFEACGEGPASRPAASPGGGGCGGGGGGGGGGGARGLDLFREDLVAFTRYRALRPLATLSYCSDAINYSTIVSTIEFDKDEELFAIAGVTKRIKVFDYEAVVRDAVDVHYPCAEMQCSHKISCVSWNAYHKNVLASSDYEGTVSVWDAATGQRTRALQEHDKRCWSVHFNRADVRLLASGSDDARVKLWALNSERSVATLEARFNVCCVRFNPRSSCHLAFGSADHCVHYYDLRAPRHPLQVFRDHRKAVSYVQFLDAHSLVSASTDSQLKLWRVDSPRCQRSFSGHANEKNFVGLATDGRYLACGSENNALYVYYAGLARPLLAHRFDAARAFLERGRDDEPADFVSAVCWRRARGGGVLLAANSQGTIKVLELV